MKSLIFTALASFIPVKEVPKQEDPIKLNIAYERKRSRVVRTILDEHGNPVDISYKGIVILIDEDFCLEKTVFN
jgi:hypothetical protein